MSSVTVVEVNGDDDDEWGDEEEVVVWSNDLNGTHGNDNGAGLGGGDGDGGSSLNTHDDEGGRGGEDGHPRGLLIASLANLAISYNVVNIGLALKIMAQIYPSESMTDESLVSAGAIFGMMAGQVIFGAAGDFLGRQFALCCTLLVCLVGAMGSALLTFDTGVGGFDIFRQLLYWRVLLGVGAGGVYPLAATLARASRVNFCAGAALGGDGGGEGRGGEYSDTGSTAVALMFSMQGVGYLAAHVTGYVILSVVPGSSPLAWRLLLGLGAVLPLALVVTLALAFSRARRYGLVQSALDGEGGDVEDVGGGGGQGGGGVGGGRGGVGDRARSSNPLRVWMALRNKRRVLNKLVGTAGSWFLFDVTFYGNQLYEEDVLQVVLGGAESPKEVAFQDSIVALVALPGYFVAAALIGRMGPRRMQVQGFFAMSLLFAAIGFAFRPLHRHAGMLMTLYSLTFFFSNFGPNSTTFMLPSLTFPDQVRGSLNGISAAAGKFGALLGGLMFEPAVKSWGVGAVLVICAMFSFAGGALTLAFVDTEQDDGPILVGADSANDSADLQEIELSGIVSGRRTANGIDHQVRAAGNGVALGLSPRPSREHTPRRTKRKGMATYSSVGATANGNVTGEGGGIFGEGTFGEGAFGDDPLPRGPEGVLGNGGEGYRSLTFGRTGEVEGQIETGDGSRWGGSSDSDGEVGGGGDLVEPSAPRTSAL